jgi:hypothetical protein
MKPIVDLLFSNQTPAFSDKNVRSNFNPQNQIRLKLDKLFQLDQQRKGTNFIIKILLIT